MGQGAAGRSQLPRLRKLLCGEQACPALGCEAAPPNRRPSFTVGPAAAGLGALRTPTQGKPARHRKSSSHKKSSSHNRPSATASLQSTTGFQATTSLQAITVLQATRSLQATKGLQPITSLLATTVPG